METDIEDEIRLKLEWNWEWKSKFTSTRNHEQFDYSKDGRIKHICILHI